MLAQANTLSQPWERWLQNLHLSGFLNETAGMWVNPTTLKDFTPSRNNLATLRTWLQADINYRIGSANQFFLRTWFVYEPPYSYNSANNHTYACKPDLLGPNGCGNTGHFAMYRLNSFYNQYNVRDAWWKLTTGSLTLYLGNQIVVWGQSLAFRVGDVINPQDTTWAFGFANLEQSRIPQWMIHHDGSRGFSYGCSKGRLESMTTSAQISVYPLRQEHLGPAIESVCAALREHGLTPQVGAMSTTVTGEGGVIFTALADAFTKAASAGQVVMTVTISNACPVPS